MKVSIGPYPDEGDQEVDVHIDKWDTWSMDHTLAHIVLPMLRQLKETKHGAPNVDDEDVPEELRMPDGWYDEKYSRNGETDPHFFERWDWILDEMIWAFEQKTMDDWNDQYYGPFIPDEKEPLGGEFEWIDHDGLNAHQERMTKAFKLFGKYYENLWD